MYNETHHEKWSIRTFVYWLNALSKGTRKSLWWFFLISNSSLTSESLVKHPVPEAPFVLGRAWRVLDSKIAYSLVWVEQNYVITKSLFLSSHEKKVSRSSPVASHPLFHNPSEQCQICTECWSLLCRWSVGNESFSNVERLNASYSHKKLKRSVGCWNHLYGAIKKWKAGCCMLCLWITCCITWWCDHSEPVWTKIKHVPRFRGWYRSEISTFLTLTREELKKNELPQVFVHCSAHIAMLWHWWEGWPGAVGRLVGSTRTVEEVHKCQLLPCTCLATQHGLMRSESIL